MTSSARRSSKRAMTEDGDPVTTPAHIADDCPLGVQLLTRVVPTNTSYVCSVCGRDWFVGTITQIEPESPFARFGRWLRRMLP